MLNEGVISEVNARTLRDAIYGMFLSGVLETVRYKEGAGSHVIEEVITKARELGTSRVDEVRKLRPNVVSIEDFRK